LAWVGIGYLIFEVAQHDAFSIAAWLSLADRNGSLAAFREPALTPPERTLAQVEGWILGVPGWIRVHYTDHAFTDHERCQK